MLHSIHRCFRWCLWSPNVPETWWPIIVCHLPCAHLHGNSTQMEHPQTGSLWGILCHNQVEFLPTRFRYHHVQWPQALAEVPYWENINNKVNHWSLELATCNKTFKWISDAGNTALDCLSRLVEIPKHNAPAASILINAVTESPADGPITHTQSKTKASVEAMPSDASKVNALPPFTGDHKDTLLQMKWTDPFCKHLTMNLTHSPTLIVYLTSMPWMPLRNFGTSHHKS